MRAIMLRALPACLVAFAVGCFTTNNEVAPTTAAKPATPTHAYWQGAAAALSQKAPSGGDMKSMVQLITSQVDTLKALSPEGVDPALVEAAEEVIQCEEEVLRTAAMFNNDTAKLKENQAMAVTFADTNRKASEAKKRLKALRGTLIEHYGGSFVNIG